jgi:hypothetical protein
MKVFLFIILCATWICDSLADGHHNKIIKEDVIREWGDQYIKGTYSDGTSKNMWVTNKLKIKNGLLRVIRKEFDDGSGWGTGNTLLLNNKVLFESKQDYVRLRGAYYLGHYTYILIGENCGGTGCRFDDLSILKLDNKQNVSLITTNEFYSENDSIKATARHGKIIIDLGLYKQAKKTAIYKNGKIRILYKKLPYKPLTAKQCSEFYEIANQCLQLHELKSNCSYSAINFSGLSNSHSWALRYISNESGYKQQLFDTECFNACKTGELSTYSVFAKNLCGINSLTSKSNR